ncbi:MAG: 50S ribosomal protein L23 [Enterobacteriaceae bacterium]
MIINKEKLINIIYKIHKSEKVNAIIKNKNTAVLKVIKNTNKIEIKKSVEKIFKIKVKSIKTLLVKGKRFKINKNIYGCNKSWKKAYIIFIKKQNLNSIIDI